MPNWLNALLFAILIVTVPFTMTLRILLQLPKPVELFHRKWPAIANVAVVAIVTALVTYFIHNTYYAIRVSAALFFTQFVVAAIAYGFGLVLMLRQYPGLYPEFLVTTGIAGLGIRRIAYRNIQDIEEEWRGRAETKLRVFTSHGHDFMLTLPTRSVPRFHEQLRLAQPPE